MSHRALKAPEEFMNEFPSYRREDLKYWARWKFYPGAVTLLVPRAIGIFIVLFLCGFFHKILYWNDTLD